MRTRIEVGRVIFLPKDKPDCWRIQTLENHVSNVTKLVTRWNNSQTFQGSLPPHLEDTRDYVRQAAEIHDIAKPAKFQLKYEQNKFSKVWGWSYSFAGHRFEAFHDDPYVQALAQLHHEYSVHGIAKNMAQMRLQPERRYFAEHLPLDLYALEMCDQIEATLACAALNDEDPEARVFMDFQFYLREAQLEFSIEPYAFGPEKPVQLSIEYVELAPPLDLRRAVETAPEENRRIALTQIQQWLLEQLHQDGAADLIRRKEVILWPWE